VWSKSLEKTTKVPKNHPILKLPRYIFTYISLKHFSWQSFLLNYWKFDKKCLKSVHIYIEYASLELIFPNFKIFPNLFTLAQKLNRSNQSVQTYWYKFRAKVWRDSNPRPSHHFAIQITQFSGISSVWYHTNHRAGLNSDLWNNEFVYIKF
jgi:hypothetical protein